MTKFIKPRKKPGGRPKPKLGPVHQLVMKVRADAESRGEPGLTLNQNQEMAAMLRVVGHA